MTRDPLALIRSLFGEWDKTAQPIKERGIPGSEDLTNQGLLGMFSLPALANAVAPVGTYEDGRTGLAWPQIVAGPAQSWKRMVDSAMAGDDAYFGSEQAARDSFDTAGLAMTGGLGAGLAGGLADDAARGVRTYRGAASDRIAPSTGENPGTVWSSTSPEVANFYAERAAGYADNDGLVMPLDIRGNYKTEGPWFGTQQWSPEWQAKIDAAAAQGYDGVRFRNVSDTINGVTSDWFATARPGGVHSATTGDLLYSNAPTGSTVPLALNAMEGAGAHPQGVRAYHGTNREFDTFDPAFMGSRGQADEGAFFFGGPKLASEYADGEFSIPETRRAELYQANLTPDGRLKVADYNRAIEAEMEQTAFGRVIPADIDTSNFATRDFGGYRWDRDEGAKLNRAIEQAKAEGKSGLVIQGMTDATGIMDPQYAVWGRGTVRSPTTGELLFSNAPTGAAVPLGMEAQDDEIDITALLAEILRGAK